MTGYACIVCKRQFEYMNHIKLHMESHRTILTREQSAYAIDIAASIADELAASGETGATESAPSPDAPGPAEDNAASGSVLPLRCGTCRKEYKYAKALQNHLVASGHSQSANRSTLGSTSEVGETSRPGKDLRAELELVAKVQYPFSADSLLINAPALSDTENYMIITPYMGDSLGTQLDTAKSLPPIGLPQIDNKGSEILMYNYMLKSRAFANIRRQKIARSFYAAAPVSEGQCIICRKFIKNKDAFYSHAAECSKLKHFSCDYCLQICNSKRSKHNHMQTCSIKTLCEEHPLEDPAQVRLNYKEAEDFYMDILETRITNSDVLTASMPLKDILKEFKEWMTHKKQNQI